MKNFILLCLLSSTCLAQEAPCGLTSINATAPLLYPPIAKAAHVEGMVIFLVTFKLSGEVEGVKVLSGPEMLKNSATTYTKGLRANEYGGPRTCPMVVKYVLQQDEADLRPIERSDIQHTTIYARLVVLSDPGAEIKRKLFWPFSRH
jgi:hypothetical protein